jgi:hypothetical protein
VYRGKGRLWWEFDRQLAHPFEPEAFDSDEFVARWFIPEIEVP